LWLVHLLKRAKYSDPLIQQDFPFQIRDVLMSAIFAAANESLAEVAKPLDRPASEIEELHSLRDRFNKGVVRAWDRQLALALDWDAVTTEPVRVQTCAGLAPLILPEVSGDLRDRVVSRLTGSGFAGADGLAYTVVPSTAPHSAGFNARSYWRGPSWPIANWLLWRGLLRHGFEREAAALRAANLALLEQPQAEFAEYFDPYTAEPLGSREQSWTAAMAIDWLAHTP
jgi:glucosylglycerate hydrolase